MLLVMELNGTPWNSLNIYPEALSKAAYLQLARTSLLSQPIKLPSFLKLIFRLIGLIYILTEIKKMWIIPQISTCSHYFLSLVIMVESKQNAHWLQIKTPCALYCRTLKMESMNSVIYLWTLTPILKEPLSLKTTVEA